jgi:hypothetical protein
MHFISRSWTRILWQKMLVPCWSQRVPLSPPDRTIEHMEPRANIQHSMRSWLALQWASSSLFAHWALRLCTAVGHHCGPVIQTLARIGSLGCRLMAPRWFWAVRVVQWSMFEINIRACHLSVVVSSIPGQTHSSCDREGDSLWQRRFPPVAPVSSYITLQIAQYCLWR